MKNFKVLAIVLALDFLMVILHLAFGRNHAFFNLDLEQNLPTIYQGVKLIFISTLIFSNLYILIFSINRESIKSNLIWLPLYAMFLFLGVDELSQFHESFTFRVVSSGSEPIEEYMSFFDRLDFTSATWLIIYIPLFIGFGIYTYAFFRTLVKRYKKEAVFLLVGVLFFLLVPILEYVNTSAEFWGTDRYESLMILEETCEMIGATFFLNFCWVMLRKQNFKISFSDTAKEELAI